MLMMMIQNDQTGETATKTRTGRTTAWSTMAACFEYRFRVHVITWLTRTLIPTVLLSGRFLAA